MTTEPEKSIPQVDDGQVDSRLFPESFTSSLGDTIREVLEKHGRLPIEPQDEVLEYIDDKPIAVVELGEDGEEDDETEIAQRLRRAATRTGQVSLTDIKKEIENSESNDKPKAPSRFRLRKRNLNSK